PAIPRAKPRIGCRKALCEPPRDSASIQLRVLSAAQANINAIFEYAQDALQARSMSELMELSASHSRRQLEAVAQQSREIANAAQKLATESARPLTGGFGSQFGPMS